MKHGMQKVSHRRIKTVGDYSYNGQKYKAIQSKDSYLGSKTTVKSKGMVNTKVKVIFI